MVFVVQVFDVPDSKMEEMCACIRHDDGVLL
jgi:hypothetical protein